MTIIAMFYMVSVKWTHIIWSVVPTIFCSKYFHLHIFYQMLNTLLRHFWKCMPLVYCVMLKVRMAMSNRTAQNWHRKFGQCTFKRKRVSEDRRRFNCRSRDPSSKCFPPPAGGNCHNRIENLTT